MTETDRVIVGAIIGAAFAAVPALWLCAFLFHLHPLHDFDTWWQVPWLWSVGIIFAVIVAFGARRGFKIARRY